MAERPKDPAMWGRIVLSIVVLAALAAVALYPKSRTYVEGRVANNVGVIYAKGLGVRQDPAEAARWYERAAQRGSAAGQFNLGFALQKGLGVGVNEQAAADWYRRAAGQGIAEAANNLAMLYANPGTGRGDLVHARAWLLVALKDADRALAASIRENLQAMERDMRPAEIAASDQTLLDLRL